MIFRPHNLLKIKNWKTGLPAPVSPTMLNPSFRCPSKVPTALWFAASPERNFERRVITGAEYPTWWMSQVQWSCWETDRYLLPTERPLFKCSRRKSNWDSDGESTILPSRYTTPCPLRKGLIILDHIAHRCRIPRDIKIQPSRGLPGRPVLPHGLVGVHGRL